MNPRTRMPGYCLTNEADREPGALGSSSISRKGLVTWSLGDAFLALRGEFAVLVLPNYKHTKKQEWHS